MSGNLAWKCPSCGYINKESHQHCVNCGVSQDVATWTCPNCKEVNSRTVTVCVYCGSRIAMKHMDLKNIDRNLVPRLPLLEYVVQTKIRQFSRLDLGNYYFIIVLHFLRDLLPFLDGLLAFGAKPSRCYLVCKPYLYAHRRQIENYLRKMGFSVLMSSTGEEIDKNVRTILLDLKKKLKRGKRFLILEDGGYVAPILHSTGFKSLTRYCIGVVEQTTRGLRKDQKIRAVRVPILNVAGCEFKLTYEPSYVGKAVVQNLRKLLPNINLSGKSALVIGFGAIGEKVAEYLNAMEAMKVYVAEKRPSRLLIAKQAKYVAGAAETAERFLRECLIIIGATGERSIGKDEISKLQQGSILASASSERVEVDVGELERLTGGYANAITDEIVDGQKVGSRYMLRLLSPEISVVLLADGHPVNFFSSESIPNESIDPIISVLFLSAFELVTTRKIRLGIHTKIVDDIVRREDIENTFLKLHKL